MFDFDLPSTWNCSANLYSLPCRNSTKFWQGKRISEMCSTFWNVFASFRCWFCCCCCFYEKGPTKLLNTFSSGRSLTSVGWKRPLCQSTAQLAELRACGTQRKKHTTISADSSCLEISKVPIFHQVHKNALSVTLVAANQPKPLVVCFPWELLPVLSVVGISFVVCCTSATGLFRYMLTGSVTDWRLKAVAGVR